MQVLATVYGAIYRVQNAQMCFETSGVIEICLICIVQCRSA